MLCIIGVSKVQDFGNFELSPWQWIFELIDIAFHRKKMDGCLNSKVVEA